MAVMARMDWLAITDLCLPSNGMWHWNNTRAYAHTHTRSNRHAFGSNKHANSGANGYAVRAD